MKIVKNNSISIADSFCIYLDNTTGQRTERWSHDTWRGRCYTM